MDEPVRLLVVGRHLEGGYDPVGGDLVEFEPDLEVESGVEIVF